MKLKGAAVSTSAVLKNDALSAGGNTSGTRHAKTRATTHSRRSAPARRPSALRLGRVEAAEAEDDRDRHVRQHGHLQQPDEALRDHAERCDQLAEEQAGRDAGADADENLSREGHVGGLGAAGKV